MANGNQEGKTTGEKVEAKTKHWFEVTRNKVVQFLNRKLHTKFRRREPPQAPHPLYLELEKGWLDLNDNLYTSRLILVENKWPAQSDQLGFEDIEVQGDKVNFAYPDGITSLYHAMGVYSDYNRIIPENRWFDHGTGIELQETPFIISEDGKEWEKMGWEKERVRYVLSANPNKPWESKSMRKLELSPGVIYHENNLDLKETLYVFSAAELDNLKKKINEHNDQFNLKLLQQKQMPVEIRTQFGNVSNSITKLIEALEAIESENLSLLNNLAGLKQKYDTHVDDLLTHKSPEGIPEFKIRFPHTYRVIKQSVMKEVEEKIRGKEPRKRLVVKHFTFKDIYEEEIQELNDKIVKARVKKGLVVDGKHIIIISLRRLISNRDTFSNEIERIINANRRAIQGILDDGGKTTQIKLEEVKGLLTHDDKAISNLLNETAEILEKEMYEIINSNDSSNTKIDNLKNLIVGCTKRSKIIEFNIKRNEQAIKGSLFPIGTEVDTDNEYEKSKDDMYQDLLYNLKVGSYFKVSLPEIDKFIESIVVKYRNEIESIIQDMIKDKKKADTDTAYSIITELVLKESKDNDDEIGLIKLHLDKCVEERDNISKDNSEIEPYESRKNDIKNLDNRDEILRDELTRKRDNFHKRTEEIAPGLDEYGHPLEVDKDGTVLIDTWWAELAQNPWQLRTIAMKTASGGGGDEVLRKHLGLNVSYYNGKPQADSLGIDTEDEPEKKKWRPFVRGTPTREIRKVKDSDLVGYIDLLDMSGMIFGYWDSLRDDIRDGRYHKHSKSVGDYVIESMGGWDDKLMAPYFKVVSYTNISRSLGWYIGRRGIDPTSTIHMRDLGYVRAKPFDFENTKAHPKRIPEDEDSVKRDFKMRLPDGVTKDGNNFTESKRKPTKYDPAFDRRAESVPFIFWGNMYYWRWAGYVNEWSENPYPHISTRGIALYLKHLAESDAYYFQDAEKILEGHRYDYGTRGQGMFPWNNPSSGKDVVGPQAEN